ncbi:Firmicu-CTERM sorting domain-containing protein [Levilactobacillus yiduensis]|uniref:Firmicu-CTERM sorting domain-containing protein n=1 Tax=Levilactobacillus yiduensis TaxID=2953880 RepID=UPI000EF2F6F1|nr:Firmicu-CTERM sorting domain-containing protein [Levilactobacillus yiduensis]AYM02289.1 Firmicu-CTERM sorting domain-containing protein [Levilactobacillus brevis]
MKLWKLMMAGVVALGLAGAAAVSATPVTAHASDNITIDGKFSDWKGADLTIGYSGAMAVKSDGQYIDVYVRMQNGSVPGYGDYSIQVDGKTYHAWSGDDLSVSGDQTKSFTLTGGKGNNGHDYGTVGAGYVGTEGSHESGEFRIDLSKFGLTDSVNGKKVSVSNPSIGSDSATTTVDNISDADQNSASGVIDGKADSSSKATTTTDTNASNDNDNLNIKIDGKFADWKHVTLTGGYNGYTAMVSDGDKVYVYVRMIKGNGQVPGYGDYNFDFNGKKIYIWSNNMPSSTVSSDRAQAVTFTGGTTNEGPQYGTVGNGYVSSNSNGEPIAEFQIDLSKLNLSSMTGQTITMYNPNIGNEKVTVAGGSTGPYVISGIGLGIAGLGYWRLRKSGKLKRQGNRTSGK